MTADRVVLRSVLLPAAGSGSSAEDLGGGHPTLGHSPTCRGPRLACVVPRRSPPHGLRGPATSARAAMPRPALSGSLWGSPYSAPRAASPAKLAMAWPGGARAGGGTSFRTAAATGASQGPATGGAPPRGRGTSRNMLPSLGTGWEVEADPQRGHPSSSSSRRTPKLGPRRCVDGGRGGGRRRNVAGSKRKPKPNSKSHRDSYSIDGCIQQLCGGSCFQTASSLSLSFVALSPVALPGTYVALNGQRLSPRISLALTPVSPEYRTNLCYRTEIESRVRGPIASLNSLVEASPAKPRQLFAAAFRPKGRRTLSQSSSRVCCRESTRT